MPTFDELKQLYGGLRPALKQGRGELIAARNQMNQMLATLDSLDSLNGDILAAPDAAGLAAAMLAARNKLREVAGYSYTIEVPVVDEDGEPTGETTTEERVITGFLDKAGAICARIEGMDSPELRAAIAAVAAAAE